MRTAAFLFLLFLAFFLTLDHINNTTVVADGLLDLSEWVRKTF